MSRKQDALIALAKALGGPKGGAIAKEVALAADDPERYLIKTKHELFEDWDDDDTDDVPWLALIEALNAAGKLGEVDWKEAASEVLARLERVGGAPVKKALKAAHEPALDERYTDEALALFGKLLGPAKLALVQLDKDSDSYALMVVPATQVAPLVKLARAAGGNLIHWTGKDLAKLEAERMRKLARDKTNNPWRKLIVRRGHLRGSGTEAEIVLRELRHDQDGSLAAEIRAVLPFVPARDRGFVELSLTLNEQPASKIAKTSRDPKLCLRALNNVRDNEDPTERLFAASVLATRLKIKPDHGKLHEQLGDALNLWGDDADVEAALKKLPSADRERLARLADGLLARNGTQIREAAARAMGFVGDATSLALLEAIDAKERAAAQARAKKNRSWSPDPWHSLSNVPKALERLRKRVSK